MPAEIIFILGIVMGAILYHMCIAPKLYKACNTAIDKADTHYDHAVELHKELKVLQSALDAELENCHAMRGEMGCQIEEMVEISRATGILSYSWPAQTDLVLYCRSNNSYRGVNPDGRTVPIDIEDLLAKIPDFAGYTKNLRTGVQTSH